MEPTEEQKRKAEIAHQIAHEEARAELVKSNPDSVREEKK